MSETVGAALRAAADALNAAGIPGAVWEARHLLADLTGLTPTQMLTDPDRPLDRAATYRAWIERRAAGEPSSRITGFRDFRGLSFRVTAETLDPRIDSEVLVDTVVAQCGDGPARIADLGTGTGCLLLTLLAERPAWRGIGVDLSFGAARTARENAVRLGLAGRAVLLRGSWSHALADASLDILISNPPYILRAVLPGLDAAVRDYDPDLALDGGTDGLDAYRAIVGDVRRVLKPGGRLFLEIGWDQGQSVPALLTARGFRDIAVTQDDGGRDRVVSATAPQ
ncbi:MAG: peptide chain release factor N(5)-glutamine methyltransferase [Alphaproteobacteria bacterium]|nr:peptide chain release factor N(5)-glutamine methyltransferase [Alphaproteobacteria bacterium]MBO6862498.1 peptide chain release factor N(5)-glutamine methyltransferase [Alphaproteobacteria bacterium]